MELPFGPGQHRRGAGAVKVEGLTTQQWAVLGALSRPPAQGGLSVGDLARYLMVSRQNLSGLLARMERAGHVTGAPDGRDRRSRLVTMTASGRRVWQSRALPKIHAYYEAALDGFSINDMAHALHYLLKMLDNMQRLDGTVPGVGKAGEAGEAAAAALVPAKRRAGATRARAA